MNLIDSRDVPLLAIYAAIVGLATAFVVSSLRRRRPGLTRTVAALIAGLVVPTVLFLLGLAAFLFIPANRSPDGPGMFMMAVIAITVVTLPISLATSFVVVMLRRQRKLR